ncbi:MAG: YidC/Oxa1 family membrane protein insertase [Actinobacteria bacterium]|nr:YidC/Oxa1 family membrane protein insertase [Actinomycetota bacterium]
MYDLIVKPLEFYYGLWPNYAGAIALLTLTIMIVLLPLTLKGTRSMLAMQKLQPEMKALQAKHRDDRQKLNEEMLKFYQENKINPMAGCLPLLLQMPVFFILYSTINGLVHRAPYGRDLGAAAATAVRSGGSYANFGNFEPKYLDHSSSLFQDLNATNQMRSFGLDLAESATKAFGSGIAHAAPYLLLVLAVAGTSYYQQRQIAGRQKGKSDNPMSQQQQMLMKIMPIFFSFISLTLPAGIVVYFLVSNTFRIGQQAFITRTMYRDEDGPVSTTARETAPAGRSKGFMEQFREIAPSPSRAKDDFKKKSTDAGSGTGGSRKGDSSTTEPTSNGNGSGGGQKPSRAAPSSANRSKSKKKRK